MSCLTSDDLVSPFIAAVTESETCRVISDLLSGAVKQVDVVT